MIEKRRYTIISYISLLLMVVTNILLISQSPDVISAIFVSAMLVLIGLSIFFGLYRMIEFTDGFYHGRQYLKDHDVKLAESEWTATLELNNVFSQKTLDSIFEEYKQKIIAQRASNQILSDIDEFINEDVLADQCWNNVMVQIPGTLTGIGILGTFLGLLMGIGEIGFSTPEAALGSIETLMSGIQTAFFTSIAGLILSIIFNIMQRILWSFLTREQSIFNGEFHKIYIPYTIEQERYREQLHRDYELERLDRIPKDFAPAPSVKANPLNGRILLPQITRGLKEGEFDYILNRRHNIYSKQVVSNEAVIRWTHKRLGEIPHSVFMPIIEESGLIAKIHKTIWENVCMTYRWDVPVALKVSKADLLTEKEDISTIIENLVEKYNIPPRMVDIEIDYLAFQEAYSIAVDNAKELRMQGFKVIIDKFDGNFVPLDALKGLSIDELKLDLNDVELKVSVDLINYAFKEAKKRNISMTAAGVKSMEQISVLRKNECLVCDGKYFSAPVSVEEYYGEAKKTEQ